jgi:NAD-dependent dihydropyrimidine dehydrogenase PreA subunit
MRTKKGIYSHDADGQNMIKSDKIKVLVLASGADICGIAPAARFLDAPEGFRPRDIFPGCKSVIVFAGKVPASSLDASSCVPSLLVNERLGNMMHIGAILVDAGLDGDTIPRETWCAPKCRLCIDSCPKKALDGRTVDQKLCRPISNFRMEKGYTLKKCNACRKVCPNRFGISAGQAKKKKRI